MNFPTLFIFIVPEPIVPHLGVAPSFSLTLLQGRVKKSPPAGAAMQ
jgi:hypothetical protein